jgi:rhodanese-related sulfurtransferase
VSIAVASAHQRAEIRYRLDPAARWRHHGDGEPSAGETVLFNKGYEGDLTANETWRFLEEDPEAILIDVRTVAEWVYVGLPDISRLGRTVVCVQWNAWPQMEVNPDFVSHLEAEGVTRERSLLLICRSGIRSRDAAIALTAAGFGPCYNVAGGFEGDLDDAKHRGIRNGWKVSGLPWMQQ